MLTSGCFSTLLTAMLAWSPPAATPEGGPVAFKLQDFRGTWHRIEDVRASKAVVISTIELTRVRAAQPARESAPGRNVRADDATALRAYDQPVPDSAKFHTVTLTVLDDDTSKPLADAEVMVLNYVDLGHHRFPTDSSGRLRFEYPYIGSPPLLNIEIRKNGYVPIRHGWRFDDGLDQPVDALTIRLRRGTTMGGIVVYAADQPVAGVTVVMTVSKYGPGKRPKNPIGYEMYYEVPSKTGPDGRWRTDSVPPGAEEVHLQLIHPDYVSDGSTTLGGAKRTPELAALRNQTDRQVLSKGAKIDGRVVDVTGKPIAGAQVVDSTRGMTFLTYVRRVFTDSEGHFSIHLPRGGDVTLTAQVKGYQPMTLNVPAEPGNPPVEFRLAPGRMLRGRVVNPQGKPIAGASLVIPSIGKHKGIFFRKWTDAQGRFEWDSAPDDAVAYMIGAEGFIPTDPISLTASDKEAVIVLKPTVDIRLRVVDAETSKPIPRFEIQVGTAKPGTQDFRWKQPTQGGSFDGTHRIVLEAEQGPYQVKVVAGGYKPAQTRLLRREEKTIREVIRLEKSPK